MPSVSSLDALFQQARPPARSLEIDQVVGALHQRFGSLDPAPVSIGRYQVAGRLGAGGLGIVYRAFDPVLSRFVAIKVLKGGREPAEHDVRLLREAQVLARIQHPHVVEVFDVGFFEDRGLALPGEDIEVPGPTRFFVAMELVEGTDLRGWLEPGRSLGEILGAFVAAAEGLHAAHQAGLLHRDFKPGNVLMGQDGAVKVADFGLAAVTQELRAELDTQGLVRTDATLSWRPGGTLHYMAPEQQRGEPLTPRSDQFGFCVSLYEAIYGGERPYDGSDRHAILVAKERGPTLPRTARIPTALRRVLARGLAPRAEDRFESMVELRQALVRIRRGTRRPWWIAAGLVMAGGTAAALMVDVTPPPVAPACATPPLPLLAGPTATTPAVEAVLRGSPPLAHAWPQLARALDAYAAELRSRWDDACSLPPDDRMRVQRCLEQGGRSVQELRALLTAGDREALAQGWSLVRELPDVQTCLPEHVGALDGEVEAALAHARMLVAAGRLGLARQGLESLLAELEGSAHALARRQVDIELAELSSIEGQLEPAQQSLERIYFESVADGDTLGASRAAVWLVIQGYRAGNVNEARQWGRAARTQLERVQPRRFDLEAILDNNLALVHLIAGELPAALTTSRQALVHASAPGVPHSVLRSVQQVHAELLMLNGRPAEALAIHRDELHTDGEAPRRDPLSLVIDLQSMGNALMTLHDVDAAHDAYRDALELGRALLGPEHPDTAAACISLAWAEGDRGQPEHGRELLGPCLEQLVNNVGEDHPHAAIARGMEARLARQQGQLETSRRLLERTVTSLEQSLGPTHYTVGDALHELGLTLAAAGDAGALATLERALEVRRAALPEGHVYIAETQAELARLHAAARRRDPARVLLEDAIAGFEARQLAPAYVEGWRAELRALDQPPARAARTEPAPTAPEDRVP
ncbi:serine/threonine-protein kinase [Paraliomyxa miuraensis]|uniref:serine/threonine-protein kinase n=1 Tax=Paraliomyxa miuraensis TaxID=376150 RepID=UPI002253B468|nr:serine/threonine-protein kinase [Paraliomyxa miuraensis]MCX4240420.1 protein kinase [Paraliomyxa miuraensis]